MLRLRSTPRRYLASAGWILAVIVLAGTTVPGTYAAASSSPSGSSLGASSQAAGDVNCREAPMAHVHDPSRFIVIRPCARATGTVTKVDLVQAYGDFMIWVQPDPDSAGLLSPANRGLFVADVIPTDRAFINLPAVGQHAAFSGAWVQSVDGGAMRMHPTWTITTAKDKKAPEPAGSPAVSVEMPSSVPVGDRIDPLVRVLGPARKDGRGAGRQMHLFAELTTLNGRGVAWWAEQTNTLGFAVIDAVALQAPGEYVFSVYAWKSHHADEIHELLTISRG